MLSKGLYRRFMMEMRTCRRCGYSFYTNKDVNICKDCETLHDATYDKIVAYLHKYPNSNALQISEALQIPAYDVLTYVEGGYLEKSKGHFERID